MEAELLKMEKIQLMHDRYIERLINLGLELEKAGEVDKAFDLYKKGLEKIDKAKMYISWTMMGLLE